MRLMTRAKVIKCVIFVNELLMRLVSQISSVLPPCCENASCVSCVVGSDVVAQHGAHAIDFKGEAMTFKATTAGVLATLQHCLDLLGQREDTWRRRLEREVERRRKVEEMYRTARQEATTHRLALHGSPDYEVCSLETEAPHYCISFCSCMGVSVILGEQQTTGLQFLAGAGIFFPLATASALALGPTQPPMQGVQDLFPLG
jgi:hypothetical protein